jgi:hypothetical protein
MEGYTSSTDELLALGHGKVPVLEAIKEKCLDCSGGSRAEVKQCLVRKCALYPYRLGNNPWRRQVSEATREVAAETSPRSGSPQILRISAWRAGEPGPRGRSSAGHSGTRNICG